MGPRGHVLCNEQSHDLVSTWAWTRTHKRGHPPRCGHVEACGRPCYVHLSRCGHSSAAMRMSGHLKADPFMAMCGNVRTPMKSHRLGCPHLSTRPTILGPPRYSWAPMIMSGHTTYGLPRSFWVSMQLVGVHEVLRIST